MSMFGNAVELLHFMGLFLGVDGASGANAPPCPFWAWCPPGPPSFLLMESAQEQRAPHSDWRSETSVGKLSSTSTIPCTECCRGRCIPRLMLPSRPKCQNWGILADARPRDICPQGHLGSEARDHRRKALFELYDPMRKEPRLSAEISRGRCSRQGQISKFWKFGRFQQRRPSGDMWSTMRGLA